jgi:hypothetical protein
MMLGQASYLRSKVTEWTKLGIHFFGSASLFYCLSSINSRHQPLRPLHIPQISLPKRTPLAREFVRAPTLSDVFCTATLSQSAIHLKNQKPATNCSLQLPQILQRFLQIRIHPPFKINKIRVLFSFHDQFMIQNSVF